MSKPQEGDVLLTASVEFGIEVIGGIVTMTAGFETAVQLSLFGGNEGDDGSEGNPETYWGNLLETDPARRYVSRTAEILRGLPATSGNLLRVEEAALSDLQWMLDVSAASSIDVTVTIPALNRVTITVVILAIGVESTFSFTENWKAAA